ncbi:Cellulose biosynthesis protein BcsQ [Jatrophihabitans endophyticus]|uniref:Cellulose biosynthesis protein BcsQ n=1 Tax=Jatrophihabitans endophyticus TaxID=1206085 RepID=A0A1M5D7D6_9ACTN|nr:AAA family ATPase [Jatrophihabitans endophyticus]SHF62582.1 Cellulose biosynthesis protein BcsQ [Jatrophihabitans endophyticus]
MRVAAVYNIKGGVGKTTTAVNLAYESAARGLRTLLWDLDAQGAATYVLRVDARVKGGGKRVVRETRPLVDAIKGSDYDRLDLLPADFTYRHLDLLLDEAKKPTRRLARLLEPLADEFDLVVLDCPPSMSLLSENVLRAADVVLVPLIPTTLSVRTLDQLTEFLATVPEPHPRLLGFFSMVDTRKRLHRDITTELPGRRPDLARTTVPALSVVEQMAQRRQPVAAYAPRSAAARRYRELWDEAFG